MVDFDKGLFPKIYLNRQINNLHMIQAINHRNYQQIYNLDDKSVYAIVEGGALRLFIEVWQNKFQKSIYYGEIRPQSEIIGRLSEKLSGLYQLKNYLRFSQNLKINKAEQKLTIRKGLKIKNEQITVKDIPLKYRGSIDIKIEELIKQRIIKRCKQPQELKQKEIKENFQLLGSILEQLIRQKKNDSMQVRDMEGQIKIMRNSVDLAIHEIKKQMDKKLMIIDESIMVITSNLKKRMRGCLNEQKEKLMKAEQNIEILTRKIEDMSRIRQNQREEMIRNIGSIEKKIQQTKENISEVKCNLQGQVFVNKHTKQVQILKNFQTEKQKKYEEVQKIEKQEQTSQQMKAQIVQLIQAQTLMDQSVTKLQNMLERVENLRLISSFVTNFGIQNLTNIRMTKLKVLNLYHNQIGAEGAKYLSSSTLQDLMSLNLRENQIGAHGAKYLASGNLHNLICLNLKNNKIRDLGLKYLTSGNLQKLSRLEVGENQIGIEGAKYLGSGNLKNLTFLGLDWNQIGNDGAKSIALGNLSNLTSLNLTCNNIQGKSQINNLYQIRYKGNLLLLL